ncbi:hypothetical protein [Mucilaginibacter sp. OK268]|uniref:hypothetical protein n=1 Tax=Mucilaginibacter sp. OK268 TaxID=1881048 RepID=UPI00115FBBA6|nr:hypothetical protein [Mucilaginibacter sp. OK268]
MKLFSSVGLMEDTWKVILPVELRPPGYGSGSDREDKGSIDHSPRNSFSTSFSLSQVLTPRLQTLLIIEPSYQHGLLATKYQRDYFTDGSERVENLPGSRYKLPIAVRFNYFLGDHWTITIGIASSAVCGARFLLFR